MTALTDGQKKQAPPYSNNEATDVEEAAHHQDPPHHRGRSKSLPKRQLNWWRLAALAFSYTAGGPFGMEPLVRAGGPILALLGLLGMPILYVMPQIILVSEMGSMMPSNHGYILWCFRGGGEFYGYSVSMLNALVNAIDVSTYPVLFTTYFCAGFWADATYWEQYAVTVCFIALCTIVNILSSSRISEASGLLAVAVCMPFVVGGFASFHKLKFNDAHDWLQTPESYDFSLLLSTLLWLYTGWINFGSLGGEVHTASVFVTGLSTALLMDALMYAIPFFIVFAQLPNISDWKNGALVSGMENTLSGLGTFVSVAGCASAAGLFIVAMLCYTRTMWGMADKRWIPSPFAKVWKKTGCPINNVALLTVVALVLGLFNFDFLVTLEGAVVSLSTIPINMSMILLRMKEPNAHRPIKFPLGTVGICVLMALPILLLVIVFSLTVLDWRIAVGVVVCFIIVSVGYTFYKKNNVGFLDEEEDPAAAAAESPETPRDGTHDGRTSERASLLQA